MDKEKISSGPRKIGRREFIIGGALAAVGGLAELAQRNVRAQAQGEHKFFLSRVEKPINLPDLTETCLSDEKAQYFLDLIDWGYSSNLGTEVEGGIGKYLGHRTEAEKVSVGIDCNRGSGGEHWIEVTPQSLLINMSIHIPTQLDYTIKYITDERTLLAALDKYWVANRDPIYAGHLYYPPPSNYGHWTRLILWRSLA